MLAFAGTNYASLPHPFFLVPSTALPRQASKSIFCSGLFVVVVWERDFWLMKSHRDESPELSLSILSALEWRIPSSSGDSASGQMMPRYVCIWPHTQESRWVPLFSTTIKVSLNDFEWGGNDVEMVSTSTDRLWGDGRCVGANRWPTVLSWDRWNHL